MTAGSRARSGPGSAPAPEEKTSEQRFIEETEALDLRTPEPLQLLQPLEDWLARFMAELAATLAATVPADTTTPCANKALARGLAEVRAAATRHMQSWSGQWAALQAAADVAEVFADTIMVLAFGKFNAGKSSFCNFIADRYRAHGMAVEYFRVDAGCIVAPAEPLREGRTETTTSVQGVRLGGKLVLLDTPGLHSVTADNAELTRRFTESADLLLWLTSSTSPGQVQELEELGRELQRHKPLLPVLTRSDVREEDEVDGEICQTLRNKTPQNRALQEDDVLVRAKGKLVSMKLDTALVRPPVSVSVLAAREHDSKWQAMTDAGFERLYNALLSTTAPAVAYKRRKHAEVFLHYLDEVVLGAMQGEVQRLLTALSDSAQSALDELEPRFGHIERMVWRGVRPAIPGLLERHAEAMDVGSLGADVSALIRASFIDAFRKECPEYDDSIAVSAVIEADAGTSLQLPEDARYERLSVDGRDATSSDVTHQVMSYERLYVLLGEAMQAHFQTLSSTARSQCKAAVESAMDTGARVHALVGRHADSLSERRRSLRSASSVPARTRQQETAKD